MPQERIVRTPDGTIHKFPAEATDEQISEALASAQPFDSNLSLGEAYQAAHGDDKSLTDYIPEPVKKGWEVANTGWQWPAEKGRQFEQWYTDPNTINSQWTPEFLKEVKPSLMGFVGGVGRGVGELATSFTSPLNLTLMALGAGEVGAVKNAITSFGTTAPKVAAGIGAARQALSVPVAAEGAYNFLRPDATWQERAMALPALAGGLAGVAQPRFPSQGLSGPQATPFGPRALRSQLSKNILTPIEPRPLQLTEGSRFVAGPEGIMDTRGVQPPPPTINFVNKKAFRAQQQQQVQTPTPPPTQKVGMSVKSFDEFLKYLPRFQNPELDAMVVELKMLKGQGKKLTPPEEKAVNSLLSRIVNHPDFPPELRDAMPGMEPPVIAPKAPVPPVGEKLPGGFVRQEIPTTTSPEIKSQVAELQKMLEEAYAREGLVYDTPPGEIRNQWQARDISEEIKPFTQPARTPDEVLPPEPELDPFGIPKNRDLTPEEMDQARAQIENYIRATGGPDTVETEATIDEVFGNIPTHPVPQPNPGEPLEQFMRRIITTTGNAREGLTKVYGPDVAHQIMSRLPEGLGEYGWGLNSYEWANKLAEAARGLVPETLTRPTNLADTGAEMKVSGINPETGRPNIAIGPKIASEEGGNRLLKLLSGNLYKGKQFQVVVKELIQNVNDLLKTHGYTGGARILFNKADTIPGTGEPAISVIVKDRGPGLTPEQLYNEYTNLGVTTKEGLDTSGKFGIAKGAPLGGGRYVEIRSIVNENGQLVEYRFAGPPELLFDQEVGVPLQGPFQPTSKDTGLTVKFYHDNPEQFSEGYEYAEAMARHSEKTMPFEIARPWLGDQDKSIPLGAQTKWLEEGDAFFNEGGVYNSLKGDKIEGIDYTNPPNETFEVIEPDPKLGQMKTADVDVRYTIEPTPQYYQLHYLNNGLYQGSSRFFQYPKGTENAPADVYLDIKTKVDPTDKAHYPWPMDREAPKDTVIQPISEWLYNKFIKGIKDANTARLQGQWDNMGSVEDVYFLDKDSIFTPEDSTQLLTKYPVVRTVINTIYKELFKPLIDIADTMNFTDQPSKEIIRTGVIWHSPDAQGNLTLGLHVRNPAQLDMGGVFINFAGLFRRSLSEPKPAVAFASDSFITSAHEIAHSHSMEHKERFNYMREAYAAKLGSLEVYETVWKPRISELVAGPDGQSLHPDVLSFLQEYDARRGGKAATENDLAKAGVDITGRVNSREGQGVNVSSSVRGGKNSGQGILEGEIVGEERGRPTSREPLPVLEAQTRSKGNKRRRKSTVDTENIDPQNLPFRKKRQPKEEKATKLREAYELMRGSTAAGDLSAAMRQGLALIGTRNWFKAWKPMVESFGSEAAYDAVQARIDAHPLVKSGFTKDAGLRLTDLKGNLATREEFARSNWAEKIPAYGRVVRASNRAYTAFLNELRLTTFADLVRDAEQMGIEMTTFTGNKKFKLATPYAKQLAGFVNDASGRGTYSLEFGKHQINMEKYAPFFNDTMFAGRLVASRMRMLNPGTYMFLPPQIRRQYLKSLLRMATFWGTMASFSKLMGADVSLDPDNADFGKIRFGNTRFDIAGGFQQYLVLAHRLVSGKVTSSVTEKSQELGVGYKAKTRRELVEDFAKSKMHPTLKFAYDLLNASEYRPFRVGDRIVQAFAPMVVGDLIQIAREDPGLLPLGLVTLLGTGAQTYEKGQTQPVFIPPEWDMELTGGSPNLP